MSELSEKQCVPCRGGVPAEKGPELEALHRQLAGGWAVVDEHHLEKEYQFDNFRQALDFTNKVGEMAEDQNPFAIVLGCSDSRVPAEMVFDQGLGDIFSGMVSGAINMVQVTIWTHKIDGLTESDFVFAAKTDAI